MTCHDVKRHLPLLLYGDLEAAPRAQVEAHLSACASCRDEHAALAATRQALASAATPAVEVDVTRILQRAGGAAATTAKRWRRLAIGLSAAAAVLVAVLLVRLEIRFEGHQLVLRWGTPPTQEVRPASIAQMHQVTPEVTAADLQLVRNLIHGLFADIRLRDGKTRDALFLLSARVDAMQWQAQNRWDATQRVVSVLHTAQLQKE